jgi:hypothetical protein
MKQPRSLVFALALLAGLFVSAASLQSVDPPAQEFPANGATDVPVSSWVSWHDPNWHYPTPAYHLQISRNSNFTDLYVNVDLPEGNTGYALPGMPKNTTFYWRVNLTWNGQTSDWSPVWSFTTTNRDIAPPPDLVSPANGATGISRSPTLVWEAVEGADSYYVQVSCLQFNVYEGNSLTVSEEALSECYTDRISWNVRSRNPAGWSQPSETWVFMATPQ